MKVLSLFDGISCGRVAFDRAGIPVEAYYAYEINEYAKQISRNNWPDIIQCGDVRRADFRPYAGIDAAIGGSPCQSLSITRSQDRQHLDGKSNLFFEFYRALEEATPTWFLFENVESMNQDSKRIISKYLGCDPLLIDSEHFSAQQRGRLYWTNIPVNMNALPSCDQVLGNILEAEVDEKYFYSAPLLDVDITKQVCGTLDINISEMHRRVFNPDHKVHTLTCVSGGNQQTLPDGYTAGFSDSVRYTTIGNGWTVDLIAFILSHIPRQEDDICGYRKADRYRCIKAAQVV